jgi:hypothetical protein
LAEALALLRRLTQRYEYHLDTVGVGGSIPPSPIGGKTPRVGDFLARVLTYLNPRKNFMNSWYDVYCAYIRHCVNYNEKNLIDPAHDEMEWNHFLPRCVFGDLPFGQWLLLKQHAVASALQTLAFEKNCLFGAHLNLLPRDLLLLVKPIYSKERSITGKKSGETTMNLKLGLFNPENAEKVREGNVRGCRKAASLKAKAIELTNILTGEIYTFPSGREASRSLGINQGNLAECARGSRLTCKGFTARYI